MVGNVQGRPDVIKKLISDEPVAAKQNDQRKGIVAKLLRAALPPVARPLFAKTT